MKNFAINPAIEIEPAADGVGLLARHKQDGHWAIFSWPQAGVLDMVFQQGHCNDASYWTYDSFRTAAHVAVNARARELDRPK